MRQTKNILMLNYEFPPIGGGGGKAHLCLLREYAGREDLKVDVLTSQPGGGFRQEKFAENITIYKVGIHKKDLHYWRKAEVLEWLFKASFRYRRLLKENEYDLVHAFFGFPTGWLCYRTAGKLPYIISLRGSDVPGYNVRLGVDYKLLAGLFRRIWQKAAAVVANSEGLRNLAQEFVPDLDIGVIPNGIDTTKFYPAENKEMRKPLRLLTVGRLIRRKRVDLLIEAVAECAKKGLDVELNIAGQGKRMAELESFTKKMGVEERVNFLARVAPEQMAGVYRDNDVFIMASAHEGMSNAMLEAMASGLPIITTGCEGVKELIDGNGLVVQKAESGSLAEAIGTLAANAEAFETMSAASRRRAQKFSWQNAAEQYINYYQKFRKSS